MATWIGSLSKVIQIIWVEEKTVVSSVIAGLQGE